MRDLMNNIHVPAVAIGNALDNTPIVSPIVDVQGYDSLTFLIAAGTLADADATVTVLVEESDNSNMSSANAVADDDLIGTELLAAFTFADDNEGRKIGYRGSKRYVRLTVTPAANASAFPCAIVPVLGHPAKAKTANPPT